MPGPDVCERFDPGFDDIDRRAPFTINGATPLVVHITIRTLTRAWRIRAVVGRAFGSTP
jgi:hypothetical protein